MELNFSTKNLTVSDRFRDYVSEKSSKVDQLAHKPQELLVKVTRYDHSKQAGQEDQVELTVYEPGHVVRAEARASDKFAAFDIAFGKLLERLRRYSDKKKVHRGGGHRHIGTSELAGSGFAELDITQRSACREYLADVESALGTVDILVNNAGAAHTSLLPLTDEDAIDRIVDLNLKATL